MNTREIMPNSSSWVKARFMESLQLIDRWPHYVLAPLFYVCHARIRSGVSFQKEFLVFSHDFFRAHVPEIRVQN